MASQNIEIEEPFIDQDYQEDNHAKGAFASFYNNLVNQADNQAYKQTNPSSTENQSYLENSLQEKESTFQTLKSRIIKNGNEIQKDMSKIQKDVQKSREIHKQLMNKKNRWKPSELELTVLKLHFEKNRYPSKEDKELILKNLEGKFSSSIDINQLTRWFQHEREKGVKQGSNNVCKNTYKKFVKEDLEYLKQCFEENTYPKIEDMIETANKLRVSLSKVENWYKHNRRSLAKRGFFQLKTKKYFKKDEVNYLVKMFEAHSRPSKDQILEMAKALECSELQIKNWCSNKKKKQKIINRRQTSEPSETKLHQSSNSMFSDIKSQADLINSCSQNTYTQPNITINTQSQVNEAPQIVQNFIQNRSFNSIPMNQFNNPIAGGLFQNNSYLNGVLVNNGMMNNTFNQNNNSNGLFPILLIPATGMNNNSLQVNQNGNNNYNLNAQEIDLKAQQQHQAMWKINTPKAQTPQSNPVVLSFNGAMAQNLPNSNASNPLQAFNPFKQANIGLKENDMSNMNFQNNNMQGSNPIFIMSNDKNQNNQLQFGLGNQQQNIIIPTMSQSLPNQMNPFMTNGFIQNNMMQKMVPYEQPMQVQYLTSLYCPYSNNNIFSNYYPVVYPNGAQNKQNAGVEIVNNNNMMFGQQQINTMNTMSLGSNN